MREKPILKIPAALVRSWFQLTADEHKAMLLVSAVFLLGLAVRTWHQHIYTDSQTSQINHNTQYSASQRSTDHK